MALRMLILVAIAATAGVATPAIAGSEVRAEGPVFGRAGCQKQPPMLVERRCPKQPPMVTAAAPLI
jgi:hypothetical protein